MAESGWSQRAHPDGPIVYRLTPASRLDVATGKAGLFGFAGHVHLIRARAVSGRVIYVPDAPARSLVEISVPAESLEVLTPPDSEEIRKVTAAMRTDVLKVERFPTITFVSKRIAVADSDFRLVGALTIAGRTWTYRSTSG
jgi:polyisoprenoid-binding protein YceI